MAAGNVQSPGKPRFLDQIRRAIRVRRFILFHNKRHPKDMGETEINSYMTHLAVNRKVAASTQTQALLTLGVGGCMDPCPIT